MRLVLWRDSWEKVVGRSSQSLDKEVMPMEQFLLDVLAAVVAGIIVALILRKMQ